MGINNFDVFKVGTVFNPIRCKKESNRIGTKIRIKYPTRLNAMAIDPSRITENLNMKYKPGEIVFSTQIFLEIEVELTDDKNVIICDSFQDRRTVIEHACSIMSQAIRYDGGFKINIEEYHNLKHCGLGSTGCLQAGISSAINHLFDCPIESSQLIKYLAQNYGEEIDNDLEHLNPIQCIGGSAASGLHTGGLLVLAGENTVIASGAIDESYKVVIGIPNDYQFVDSKSQFDEEKDNLDKFLECGNRYKHEIAYNILHDFLPAIVNGDLKTMGDVIFDYRYDKGSIENCSYTYPGLVERMDALKFLKEEGHVDILSISSVGPAVFAIGKDMSRCMDAFRENSMSIIQTKINNDTYKVLFQE